MAKYTKTDCVHFENTHKCKLSNVRYVPKSCSHCSAYLQPNENLSYEDHVKLSVRNLDLRAIDTRERVKTCIAVISAVAALVSASISYSSYQRSKAYLTRKDVTMLIDKRIGEIKTDHTISSIIDLAGHHSHSTSETSE